MNKTKNNVNLNGENLKTAVEYLNRNLLEIQSWEIDKLNNLNVILDLFDTALNDCYFDDIATLEREVNQPSMEFYSWLSELAAKIKDNTITKEETVELAENIMNFEDLLDYYIDNLEMIGDAQDLAEYYLNTLDFVVQDFVELIEPAINYRKLGELIADPSFYQYELDCYIIDINGTFYRETL